MHVVKHIRSVIASQCKWVSISSQTNTKNMFNDAQQWSNWDLLQCILDDGD